MYARRCAKMYIEKVKKNLENASLNLQLERLKLLQYCVELTTINKQPFALLLKSGFQKIVADKLQELQKGGLGLNLKDTSFGAVQTHIHKTAERIRSIIGCEIKNRLFSTSTDIVTKNNRSIFGIYIQYMMSGELRIGCAGMRELHDRHTGKYLSEILDACLKNYGASLHNVFSLTTDNGSNMKTLLSCMNNIINDETDTDIEVSDADDSNHNFINDAGPCSEEHMSYDEASSSASNLIDQTDQMEITNLMSRLLPIESDWSFDDGLHILDTSQMASLVLINGVNCAAHTLQLAIKNALFKLGSQQSNVIKLSREACKFIRLQKTIYEMEKRGIRKKFPALDVDTRWSSTYMMVRRKYLVEISQQLIFTLLLCSNPHS